jgi:hypothetical protein
MKCNCCSGQRDGYDLVCGCTHQFCVSCEKCMFCCRCQEGLADDMVHYARTYGSFVDLSSISPLQPLADAIEKAIVSRHAMRNGWSPETVQWFLKNWHRPGPGPTKDMFLNHDDLELLSKMGIAWEGDMRTIARPSRTSGR